MSEHPVTVGYSALGISLPVFVAHQLGIFADYGLPMAARGWPNAHPLVESIAHRGDPQLGGFIAFPISFLRHLRTRPLYYLGAVYEDSQHPISFLLVRRGSGIHRLQDLAGRRVGVLPTKAYREWLKLLGASAGLGYHQIKRDRSCTCMDADSTQRCAANRPAMKVFDVDSAETSEALRLGRVDAVFTNDPAVTASVRGGVAEILGDEPILPALLGSPHLFGSFVVDSELVRREPGVAQRVAAALDEAIELVRREPDRARRCAAAYLPDSCADLSDSLGLPQYLTSGEVRLSELQAMADQMASTGIIPEHIDVAPWILRAQGAADGQELRAAG